MATTEEKLLLRLEADARKLINETKKANDNFRTQMKAMDAEFTRGNQKAVDGMTRKVRTMNEASGAARNYGSTIQNAAFQIGDFAVQVAGGTSATRAAAQQLPQLLGGLGVLGAVAGAVAAVAVPLAANWLAAGETMADQVATVKALADAMRALSTADEAANADPMSLVDRFGSAGAEQAKQVLEIERRIAELRAQSALGAVAQSIGGMGTEGEDQSAKIAELEALRTEYDALYQQIQSFREVRTAADQEELDALIMRRGETGKLIDQQINGMSAYREQMTSLAEGLGLAFDDNEAAIARVNDAMLALAAANTPQELASGGKALADALLAASDNGKGLNEEGRQLLENLSSAQLSALELARIDIASGIAAGADEAARLKGELAAAANAWLAARSIAMTPGNQANTKYAGRGTEDSRPVTLGTGEVYKPPSAGKGGRKGGGAGGAKAEDWLAAQAERAQAALDAAKLEAAAVGMTAEAAATAKAKLDLLAEAKRRNLDLDKRSTTTGATLREEIDRQAASIGALTVEAEKYKERAQFMASMNKTLEDGFVDAIVSGQGFSGVLQDLAKQLAKAALQAALFGSGPFAQSGGGGGLLGGIFSNLLSFDGGGSTGGAPRTGGLDGKGGFLAMMHPQEDVIDRTKGQSAGGGLIELRVASDPSVIVEIARNETGRQVKVAMAQVPSIVANHNKRKS